MWKWNPELEDRYLTLREKAKRANIEKEKMMVRQRKRQRNRQ